MKISRAFQGKFFGDIIDDVYKNYGQIIIPEFFWEDGSKVILQKGENYNDPDKLRWFLKVFDEKFPKDEKGNPRSMATVDTKTTVNHIEYIRLVLSHNGAWLKTDEEEWDRLKEFANR